MDSTMNDIIAIILAAAFGAVIGIEREYRRKAAGLRTNVLICIGAAVFTIISAKMGAAYEQSQSRIAAQIVTGVGFLGAGAIIRDRGGILGLTTAATIWLVASIGMACGAGYYKLAIGTTAIALAVLLGLSRVEKWIQKTSKYPTMGLSQQDENSDILPD
ncbi:MAG: MgtC/SapB family protein [Phycisphaerales bacterium]|jgi:putative Mg2+ transporter-C (MgtC) family protein